MSIKILFLVIMIMMIPFATPLSFNFQNFTPNDHDIIYYSSAYAANNVIQLTRNLRDTSTESSIGRATYAEPLYLWDRFSGNLTDFTTQFSFSINSLNRTSYGDGLAFFLVPNGSSVPENSTGASLGLASDSQILNSVSHPFVAIEFDIYPNIAFDPPYNLSYDNYQPYEHVGIDVNSMRSIASTTWWCGNTIVEGREHHVSITYDSKSMNLSVVFTGVIEGKWFNDSLTYTLDLRNHLPEFVQIGFSAATGLSTAIHSIISWSFSSNLVLDEPNPEDAMPPDSTAMPGPRTVSRGRSTTALLTVLVVGGLVLVLVLGYCFGRKKRKGTMNGVDETRNGVDDISPLSVVCNQAMQDAAPTEFTYDHLKKATNNFTVDDKLGEGGFGSVYKGLLEESNTLIAVKKISSNSEEGTKGYVAEVKIISTLRHKNLVQLLGWCHERKQELLLVYEFMPNGSLDSHLFKGKSLLKWGTRYQIAKDLAAALLYLHESWKQCVLHRDIKSSNVMLDADFNAKLGDFGLARLVDPESEFDTTVPAGTIGYMAPELFMETGKASKETDVFSFGIVALEIATGKRAIHGNDSRQGRVNLADWAWSLHETGKLHEGADPGLGSDYNWRELVRLMTVGLWCAHPDSNIRPSMKEAAKVLDCEAGLPDLHRNLSILSLSGTSVSGSNRYMWSDTTQSSQRTTGSFSS